MHMCSKYFSPDAPTYTRLEDVSNLSPGPLPKEAMFCVDAPVHMPFSKKGIYRSPVQLCWPISGMVGSCSQQPLQFRKRGTHHHLVHLFHIKNTTKLCSLQYKKSTLDHVLLGRSL